MDQIQWKREFMSNTESKLMIVSGFSGSGKGSVLSKIRHIYQASPQVCFPKSVTTRPPRPGNEEEYYHFWTIEEVRKVLKTGYFLETSYSGMEFYGTPASEIRPGCMNILELDCRGKQTLEKIFPPERLVSVFILPRTAAELAERLCKRGTEKSWQILRRLTRALEELDHLPGYDYLVINDDVTESVDRLCCIIAGSVAVKSDRVDLKTFREDLSRIVEQLREEDAKMRRLRDEEILSRRKENE